MDIIGIDQQLTLAINGSDSLFWDNVMLTTTSTLAWTLPFAMLLYIIYKNNKLKEALLIVLTLALLITVADRICSGWVKPTIARWRPTQDPTLMYLVDVVNNYRGGRYGFFSGHACNTFCMATFLSLLFRSRRATATLFFWCTATTFTRLYLGVHYLGDVTVGLCVGILLGTLFYIGYDRYIHRRFDPIPLISEQFTPTGYRKADINRFVTIVFLNYNLLIIIAMIRSF